MQFKAEIIKNLVYLLYSITLNHFAFVSYPL